MSDLEVMIEARNLQMVYNRKGSRKTEVLRDVSLKVHKGECVAVCGPSGAGKTTLLNLLAGMDEPTGGQIYLEGRLQNGISRQQKARIRNKRIGMVFQFYHLLPDFTALENVMLPAWLAGAGGKKTEEHARQLLADVGLGHRNSHFPSELSGGEMQRAAIARALINNPEVIFCDEPTGNLDSATGEQVCSLLKNLSGRAKKTIVIVTHDDKIADIVGRVLHMKDGVLGQSSTGG